MEFNIFKPIKYHFTLLVFLMSISASAGNSEYTKTYTKTYSLADGGKVNIENMHGRVNISTWNKSEVYIKVVITVDASSERKAEEDFDRINIDFSNDSRYVSAKTTINTKKSNWWFIQSWWDDNDVRIDYEVSMPANAKLELTHKYGNADLGSFSGDVFVSQKYGDLSIDEVAGYLDLDLAYGNASVARANNSSIEVAYYKLRMNDANKITINSKYSQVHIESANEIISESSYDGYHLGDIGRMSNEGKYDNMEIDKIEQLDINTKYTKVNLQYLVRQLKAEMSYGGLEVDRLDNGFSEISITSRYTGLEIDASEATNYKIDVQGKYTGVKIPTNLTTSRDQRENNSITVIGHHGSSSAQASIWVRAEYGGLKIL